jgi:choline dehydrogenase-like flavoprotein
MHSDLSDLDEKHINCDICIIGSGPAGLAVASKLIDEDIKFVILESGDIDPSNKHQELNKGYSNGKRKLNLANSRLRCFGGAGRLWAGVCRPFDPAEFNVLDVENGGWPITYSDLEKYYEEAADILGLNYKKFFNEDWRTEAELAVRFSGFAQNDGILRGKQYQQASFKNRDLTNRYKNTLFESNNCIVITNATVVDMIQSKKNLVEKILIKSISGKVVSLTAKTFVLCAGAIENPRILLDSSLNHKIKENKFLGSCFMSHPAFRGAGSLILNESLITPKMGNKKLNGNFGFEMSLKEREKSAILRHNISIKPSLTPGMKDKDLDQFSIIKNNISKLSSFANRVKRKLFGGQIKAKKWNLDIAIEQEPRLENYLKLSSSKDILGNRQVEIYWDFVSDKEMKTVLEAVKAVGRESMLNDVGITKVSNDLINKEIFNQDDAINHHIGTTRMGVSSDFGVVNSNLKCFSLSNLFISGSSVFPTSSIVNPTFSIVALSLRLGEHIVKRSKLQES